MPKIQPNGSAAAITGTQVTTKLGLDVYVLNPSSGGSSDATAAKQDTGNTSLASIDTKLTSQATAAKQDTGNTSVANVDTNQGAKADAAATTDTGTFSLIALVKRLLQSLTTGNASTASIDTKATAGNASTASIDGKIFSQKVSTSSCTNASASASTTALLASTAGRRGAYFYNDSSSDAFLKLGATASITSFTTKIGPYGYYELPTNPVYTGAIDCIWTVATGAMRITELS